MSSFKKTKILKKKKLVKKKESKDTVSYNQIYTRRYIYWFNDVVRQYEKLTLLKMGERTVYLIVLSVGDT